MPHAAALCSRLRSPLGSWLTQEQELEQEHSLSSERHTRQVLLSQGPKGPSQRDTEVSHRGFPGKLGLEAWP